MEREEKQKRKERLLLRAGWITVLLRTDQADDYFTHGQQRKLRQNFHKIHWFIPDELAAENKDGEILLQNDKSLTEMMDDWFSGKKFRESIEKEPGVIDFRKAIDMCHEVHELVAPAGVGREAVGQWMNEEMYE